MNRHEPARIAVFGLGYVGLPVVRACVNSGRKTIGFDVDLLRLKQISGGRSPIEDVSDEEIQEWLSQGFIPTADRVQLAGVDVFVICVPTPLGPSGAPDLSAVEAASKVVSASIYQDTNPLVILESTTYPGTTEEVVKPILEETGLVAGEDFALAFSPERIDPGNTEWSFGNTPKVVGGFTTSCADRAEDFYASLGVTTVRTKGLAEAEMSKLLENTYRHINIALVNELWKLCHELKIDIWDVIRAAETKPYGFEPFFPGPGVGGHCIPIDPNYLGHRVKAQLGKPFRFVELAQEVNASMPGFVVQRANEILNMSGKPLMGSKVLLVGVSYKPNISDIRESPAITTARLLVNAGCRVSYVDPHVAGFSIDGELIDRVDSEIACEDTWDLVVVLQQHDALKSFIAQLPAERVFNTRGPS